MDRQELLYQIEHYVKFNDQEEIDSILIRNWIADHEYAFLREN